MRTIRRSVASDSRRPGDCLRNRFPLRPGLRRRGGRISGSGDQSDRRPFFGSLKQARRPNGPGRANGAIGGRLHVLAVCGHGKPNHCPQTLQKQRSGENDRQVPCTVRLRGQGNITRQPATSDIWAPAEAVSKFAVIRPQSVNAVRLVASDPFPIDDLSIRAPVKEAAAPLRNQISSPERAPLI
jgi:hypothetical protein